MSARPLVSILTPSLNQARFIQDCIDSVTAQTYRPLEHVIVDGASTDGTVDLLQRAPTHVRWVSQADRGQSHALNNALGISRGEIIGWLNSDDAYADRRAVEWAVKGLQQADAVFGHALLINESNEVLQVMASPPFWRRLVEVVHYPVQPTFFFRRRLLEEHGFVDDSLRYVMDRDLLLRVARHARIRHLGRVIALDRHQGNRKVLSPAYVEEARAYDQRAGIRDSFASRAIASTTRAAMRLYGVPIAALLPASGRPAINLRFPSTTQRLARQCLMRRRDMPFETESSKAS